MSQLKPFVDIHCHLLPGLDDGPATAEEALAMAEMAVADGLGTIIATTHQLGNFAKNSASDGSHGGGPVSATPQPAARAPVGASRGRRPD